jgi:uncharacterized protein YbbK (DUF523 family)/uncharacterized protein YbgA (DUF1722 family)
MTSLPASRTRSRPPSPAADSAIPIRIGVSSCLLGVEVRFDGGHREDRFLTGFLGRHCQWVPVCPEYEVGLGVPREPMRLEGTVAAPRLVTVNTRIDHTQAMEDFARRRTRELAELDLDGYIFKQGSPSCGTSEVRVYSPRGRGFGRGVGLFARRFVARFPRVPVAEEGGLRDRVRREQFVTSVLGHWRWRSLVAGGVSRRRLAAFHAAQQCLILTRSPKHWSELTRLLETARGLSAAVLAERYGDLFAQALQVRATRRKHAQVLMLLARALGDRLSGAEKARVRVLIEDYRAGRRRLVAPLRLIERYGHKSGGDFFREQVYLNPHPIELWLRNQDLPAPRK